jgi:hypothetical protein
MVTLELNQRFPADGLTETAWQSGIAAFRTERSTNDP